MPTEFWLCTYTLEEDVVVQCEDQNQLVLPGCHQISFSWYDVRDIINWCLHGCSGREAPLTMGMDAGEVVKSERLDNAMVRW